MNAMCFPKNVLAGKSVSQAIKTKMENVACIAEERKMSVLVLQEAPGKQHSEQREVVEQMLTEPDDPSFYFSN